jgi:hypothetical protein
VALIVFAALDLWAGIRPGNGADMEARFNFILDGVASLTIAAAALGLGQTIFEEEVLRSGLMSAPTRVRHFISRFLLVIVVALSVESLVAVFRAIHGEPGNLPEASGVALVAAALLAGWGVFVKLNRSAEELEPEAIERTKRQAEKIEKDEDIQET